MKRLPVWRRPLTARRVLDIGAGHNPYAGATHILEIDPGPGRQRGGNPLQVPEQTRLTIGDVQALPYRAGSFDFVYASHVLEHVDTPDTACQEVMRVGKAGYLETPSPFLEQGLALLEEEPQEHWIHKWFVFTDVGTLIFEPKTAETVQEFCSCQDGQFMREFFSSVHFGDAQHYFRRRAKTTWMYWRSRFGIEVRDKTVDCRRDGNRCRFEGMRRALLANCNDLWRVGRLVRLSRDFPACRLVFRKYGFRTLFV